jgi:hypothetical protein
MWPRLESPGLTKNVLTMSHYEASIPDGGVPSFTLFLTGLSCVGSFLASCWERWLGTVRWWWWWWWWWWVAWEVCCCSGGPVRLCWWCEFFDTPRLLVQDPLAFTTVADEWWFEWWSTSEGSYTSAATSTGKTGRCSWSMVLESTMRGRPQSPASDNRGCWMAACCGGICCQDGTTICLLPGHDVCTAFCGNTALLITNWNSLLQFSSSMKIKQILLLGRKIPAGRTRCRWENGIKMDLTETEQKHMG